MASKTAAPGAPQATLERFFDSETGRVGIVVISGPVTKVARISAVDDLAISSGWPILGVVGVPRLHRRPATPGGGRVRTTTGWLVRHVVDSRSESGAE